MNSDQLQTKEKASSGTPKVTNAMVDETKNCRGAIQTKPTAHVMSANANVPKKKRSRNANIKDVAAVRRKNAAVERKMNVAAQRTTVAAVETVGNSDRQRRFALVRRVLFPLHGRGVRGRLH